MKKIVLASTSPYRKHQLEILGISFDSSKPLIDEEKEKDLSLEPEQLALKLSYLKAQSLVKENQITIGGDQLVHLHGEILGKPGNKQQAFRQIMKLQGQSHQLITAVTVFNDFFAHSILNVTTIKLKDLNPSQIEKYLELDQPYDCAGSYKIEKHGIQLIELIQTSDFTAIQGLPLLELSKLLGKLGIHIP